MNYDWDFGTVIRNLDLLLEGAVVSLQVTFFAIALAIPVGVMIGTLRMSRIWPISLIGRIFIDFFRTSAVLVLIFWFYFALPVLSGLEIAPFEAAVLAIGLQAAAYFAEIFRGAVGSIDKNQWEAASAIGLSKLQSFRLVILPQAIRRMLPVSFNLAIITFKNTSLAAAIACAELTYQASIMASTTYRPIETYTIVALIYLILITSASFLVKKVEAYYTSRGFSA